MQRFPIPNVAIPPGFKAVIDAYEKSTEIKAVALASEDKTFGSKQWVMGHFSGNVSQEEANGRAMSSCLQYLDQEKNKSAGGKPLYNFGNKTCELYKFKNEKNVASSTKNFSTADDCKRYVRGSCVEREPQIINKPTEKQTESKVNTVTETKNNIATESKITIDLPQGWIAKDIPENLKVSNPEMFSCNLTIGGCFLFWTYPEKHIYSLLEFVNTARKAHVPSASLSEISLSDVEIMELYGNTAYRYTMTGLLNKTQKYTYQITFFKLGNKFTKLTLWLPENRYSDTKEIISKVASSFKDLANIKPINNPTNSSDNNKNADDLSNLPAPMN